MPNAKALKAGREGPGIEARGNMEERAIVEGKPDRDGDGEVGGSQHQTPETASNIVDGCSGTGGDAASIGQSAGEAVAGVVEVQRDGEGDDAFMVSSFICLFSTVENYCVVDARKCSGGMRIESLSG